MLDHKGLPNFKLTGMICGVVMLVGSFYYFSRYGLARSYDFEIAVLLFFLLTVFTRQMFNSLRDDEPLRTMAYTLFGLLYVLWLYNFITKIVYVVAAFRDRRSHRPVLLFVFDRGDEIQRHGRIHHRKFDRAASVDSAHQPEKDVGRFFWCSRVFAFGERRAVSTHAGTFVYVEHDARHRARIAPRFRRRHWRFGGIDHQAQHRRERFGQHVAGDWRRARLGRQPALHRAAAVLLPAVGGARALTTWPNETQTRRCPGRDGIDWRKCAQSGARHSGADGNCRLAAKSNARKLAQQANATRPGAVCLVDESKIAELRNSLTYSPEIFLGEKGLCEIATLPDSEMVLIAIVGTGGLRPALAAIEAGKDLAVASKEILVMAGEIVMREARAKGVHVLPVDSEHNAIFQCLEGKRSTSNVQRSTSKSDNLS